MSLKMTKDDPKRKTISPYDLTSGVKSGARLQQLRNQLASCKQQGSSVDDYFGRLTKLWDEIADCTNSKHCSCGKCECDLNAARYSELEVLKIHGFLSGLDDDDVHGAIRFTYAQLTRIIAEIAKLVKDSSDSRVTSFQKLCPRICKLLSNSSFLAKSSLLPIVSSLSQVGAIEPQSLDSLLEGIHGCLGSTDWLTRKAAAETLTALASHSSNLLKDKSDSTITRLENCRSDEIKTVRESVREALHLWEKNSGKRVDGALEESKISFGEQLGSAKTGEKRCDLAVLMRKETFDGSTLSLSSVTKEKGGPPEKDAVVMLNKKAPALSDREFFLRVLESGLDGLNSLGSSNCFKDIQADDQGFLHSKFHNFDSASNKLVEGRFYGNGLQAWTSVDNNAGVVIRKETSGNQAAETDDQSEGSAIQRQLLQLKRQQTILINMLQEFIGSSHDSMVTLEGKFKGLERIVEDMGRDLSTAGFGKYQSFANYNSTGKYVASIIRERMMLNSDIPPHVAASRNGQAGPRSPRSKQHENEQVGNGRRGWDKKSSGTTRFGESPAVTCVWKASKGEATVVASEDGAVTRPTPIAAVPEAGAMGDEKNKALYATTYRKALRSLHAGDINSAYAEVFGLGDQRLVKFLMGETGPTISRMSNENANEALNFIAMFLMDHNLYGMCVSWIQQLVAVLLQRGSETFEVPMDLRDNVLFNFQQACPTNDPWEQLVEQLASAWNIEMI